MPRKFSMDLLYPALAETDAADDRAARKAAKKAKKAAKKERKKEKKKEKKKKRKRDSSDSDSSSSAAPAVAARPLRPGEVLLGGGAAAAAISYPGAKRRAGGGGSGAILPLTASEFESSQRSARAARFEPTAAEAALAARASRPEAPLPAGAVLSGRAQNLEKAYLRLTAMPRADDVRPLPVLRDAFALVERRWAAEADYVWAREQLKSIRQDLTVQHLAEGGGSGGGGTSAARFACKVYEGHARIALQADDLDEFNQCLAQLLPLHARRLQTADAAVCEFAGYRLLRAATRRPGGLAEELHAIVSALSDAQRADGGVRRCLRAAAAVDAHDALRACAAVFSLPHHAAALLRPRLPALRARGLRALCRAFAPSLPLAVVAVRLGFADDASDGGGAGAAECEKWLRQQGAVILRTAGSDPALDTKATAEALRNLAAASQESAPAVGPPMPRVRLADHNREQRPQEDYAIWDAWDW